MLQRLVNIFNSGGVTPDWTTYMNADYKYEPSTALAAKEEAAGAATEKKADKDDGLTFKDFAKLIQEVDGLPNDKRKMLESVKELFAYTGVDGGINQAHAQQVYLSILSQIGSATQSKEAYEKAAEKAEKAGGMYEAVISDTGHILVMDSEGNQAWATPEEYAKNRDKLRAVTNNDVLVARAESDGFAFRDNTLAYVSNAIGIKEVSNLIEERAKDLGSTSTSQEGYVSTDGTNVGIQFLQEAIIKAKKMQQENPESIPGGLTELMTLQGLYKAKIITKDNYTQIASALNYIWNTLPQNAKTLIKTRCQNGTDKEAVQIVSQLLMGRLTQDYDIEADLQDDVDIDVASSKSKAKSKTTKDSELKNTMLMLFETGNVPMSKQIFFAGTSDAFQANVYTAAITEGGDKKTGDSSLQHLTETDLGPLIDFSSVWMGDQRITNLSYACTTEGKVSAVYLPSEIDPTTNAVKPQIAFISKIEGVKESLRKKNIMKGEGLNITESTSSEQKMQLIKQANKEFTDAGLKVYFTDDGLVNRYDYTRFAVFQGGALSQAFEGGEEAAENAKHVQKLSGDLGQVAADEITRTLCKHAKDDEKKKYQADVDAWFFDDIVCKGLIFIPLTSSYLLAATSSGVNIPDSRVIDLYNKDQKIRSRAEYVEAPNP